MENKLCIFVCSHYLPEAKEAIKSGYYPDVVIKSFPSICTAASARAKSMPAAPNAYSKKYSRVVFIGSTCRLSGIKNKENLNNVTFVELEHCFELLVNKELISHLIRSGCYLVSNGWLRNYKRNIENWGFDAATAKLFFKESVKKIVLLDTGIKGDYWTGLETLAEYMGADYEILPVGLSHCKLQINLIISAWNEEKERSLQNNKLALAYSRSADYALAFNQLNNLIDNIEESEIVGRIFDFLNILFLPRNICYTPFNNEAGSEPLFFRESPLILKEADGSSFKIELSYRKELLGIIEVIGIAFPRYIEKYREVSGIIGHIGGLALSNARKFRIIKEDEIKIRQYSEELKKLNATKDKFFSILAHDLRGYFSGFMALSEAMSQDIDNFSREELAEMSEALNASSRNLFKLLINLLEWARMQQGGVEYQPAALSISKVINRVVSILLNSSKQKGIKIAVHVPRDLTVFADEVMLETVLRNLLSNALKFTGRGGTVIVSAAEAGNNMVCISVADTGIGIPEDMISKLFKIEEKTGRTGTEGELSTGLGLLLCREFVEKHGGTIWAEPNVSRGSVFHFTLPQNTYI